MSVISRRDFMRVGSTAGAALVIGFHVGEWDAFAQPGQTAKPVPSPFNAWIRDSRPTTPPPSSSPSPRWGRG